MSKVEIVSDEMGGFEIYGREYQVSPATDTVIRFVDSEYDYLRYLDPEQHAVTLHWLGQSALSNLTGWGIPETRQRLKMQNCEYEEFLQWSSNMAMGQFEAEVADIPTDGFDAA